MDIFDKYSILELLDKYPSLRKWANITHTMKCKFPMIGKCTCGLIEELEEIRSELEVNNV